MKIFYGSVLWIFVLFYFTLGQISDIDDLSENFDEIIKQSEAIAGSAFTNEDTKQQREKLEASEKEESDEATERIKNKAAVVKSRGTTAKPQEYARTESSNRRGRRRQLTQRTRNLSNVSEIPMMSQERRNSYLSIAERRKYYNKTQERTKKPETIEVELENQETIHEFVVTPITETLRTNEISTSEKPDVKETADKKIQSSNQKRFFPQPSEEVSKQKKFLVNTRQAVIQSQLEFGQKLISRKPTLIILPQESQEEKTKRNQVIQATEVSTETSKNNSRENDSTTWLGVDQDVLSTDLTPSPKQITERNQTDVVDVDGYEESGFTNSSNTTSFVDNRVGEHEQISRLSSLPSHNISSTVNATDKDEESRQLYRNIEKVYNQEIFRVNVTENPVQVSPNVSDSNEKVAVKSLEATGDRGKETVRQNATADHSTDSEKIIAGSSSGKAQSDILRSNDSSSTNTQPFDGSEVGQEKASSPTVFAANQTGQVFNRTEVGKEQTLTDESATEEMAGKDSTEENLANRKSVPAEWPSTNADEFPLTIELNENNKRVLSEMFHNAKSTEPFKVEHPTTSIPNPEETTTDQIAVEEVTTSLPTTETIKPTTLMPTSEVPKTTPESSRKSNTDTAEDRKAVGTRYNTKYYIHPNASRTQQKIIKVIVNEDDDDDDDDDSGDDADLLNHSLGITTYVLALFGIVPILLAMIFFVRFAIQRGQRQYECESDGKSEIISTSEYQSKQGSKGTGSDLKKSPSNVTTTTLVATSRLPRVHHWDNLESHGNKNWEVPRSKVKLKTILGQGNFGQVWKAEIDDVPGHDAKPRLVAVKTVKEGATEKENMEFIKELEIMQQIGSHPNIVTLLGCCTDQEPHYLIMEYVKNGKLLTYLRDHRINENYYNFSNNEDALTSRDLTVFAYCISRGMEYLASRGIIHRDLAARNVLVDQNKVCKIADFGMSRSIRNLEDGEVYEERQHKGALPIRWMAPESLVYSVFTHKSDVWSFGIVMWEIVTLGSTPYPNMGARELMRRVREGYRLERPSHCKPEFYRLMSHCWAHDPNKRPDFSELRQDLSNLLENPAKEGSYVDLDQFAIDKFYVTNKSRDVKLLERNELKSFKRLEDWEAEGWPEEMKRAKGKKGRNTGKGTVTLTGQGSFTVNSRILEKEFKMI